MDLIELAIQGVRRFNSALRFSIKDGYNVFFGPNECGKTTLFESIIALLDRKYFEEKARTFVPWETVGAASRAGLVFKVGADQLRLIKDFSNASTLLSRMTGNGSYEPLSREADWIHEHMSGTLGIPSGELLHRIFLSSAMEYERYYIDAREHAEVPSQEGIFPAGDEDYELGGGISYSYGDYNEEEAIKARLQQLKEELILVEQINEIQFQVDGLQSKVDEIESKLKEIKVIDEKIKLIDEELKKLDVLSALPEGIETKIENLKQQEESKNKEFAQLDNEKQRLRHELAALERAPFYKELTFIIGISTAIPFLIAQFIFTVVKVEILSALIKFAPLIWIPGWGLLFYAAWNEINRKDKLKKARKSMQEIEERARTVNKKYELEALLIKNVLQQAKVSAPWELVDSIQNMKMLKTEKKKLQEEKEALKSAFNLEALLKQKKELEDKIKEDENRLQMAGGFSMDPNEIRKEIQKLETMLKPSTKPGSSGRKPTQRISVRSPWNGGPTVRSSSPLRGLLKQAEEFMKKGHEEILGELEEELRNSLGSLTGNNYESLRLKEGEKGIDVSAVRKDGREASWKDLSPSSKEGIFFALKLTILNKIIETNPLPLVLDEPFIFADESRIVSIAKIFQGMAKKTKILHFTSKAIFAKAGNQVYNLKGA